jgi:hypothetical protein
MYFFFNNFRPSQSTVHRLELLFRLLLIPVVSFVSIPNLTKYCFTKYWRNRLTNHYCIKMNTWSWDRDVSTCRAVIFQSVTTFLKRQDQESLSIKAFLKIETSCRHKLFRELSRCCFSKVETFFSNFEIESLVWDHLKTNQRPPSLIEKGIKSYNVTFFVFSRL